MTSGGSSIAGSGQSGLPLGPRLARAVVVTAVMVPLLFAIPSLRPVLHEIFRMRLVWVGLAVALEVASCGSFVVVFRQFFDRVPREMARPLAWTEVGAGALLPGGGIGSLAAGGWLLRRAGMTRREILKRSSGLFFLTSGASVAAMVAAGGLLVAGTVPGPRDPLRAGAPILAGLLATAAVLALPPLWRRWGRGTMPGWTQDLVDGIGDAVQTLIRPSWRLLGAVGYLGFDIAVLAATFAAVGHPLPIAPLVLGYIIGYLANLLPIPGSVGVLDGGLAGALIVYGADPARAAAAVLVYHAVSFWIPSLTGLWGYALVRRQLTGDGPALDVLSRADSLDEVWQEDNVSSVTPVPRRDDVQHRRQPIRC